MPFGEEHSSTFLIEVDGSPLPGELASLLVTGRVDDSTTVPDLFSLIFTDATGTLLERASIRVGTAVTISVKQNGPRGAIPLISGEVTAVEREMSPQGLYTVVRGLDHSHRLFRGTRVAAYLDSTPADIVRAVAARAGLEVGDLMASGPVISHISQDGVSDWDFLRRLAAQMGANVTVNDGAVSFLPPTEASTAPSGSEQSRDDPLVLQQGANVLALRATVTSAGQVPDVEVRGWSVEEKREVVSVAEARTVSAVLADATPVGLAEVFDSPRYVAPVASLEQQSQYEATAAALSSHLAGGFAEVEGTVRGNPSVRAGSAVKLVGFGSPFDGQYTVSSSHHSLTPEAGYLTDFTVSSTSDRSLYGVVAGANPSGGNSSSDASPQLSGVVSAIVTATNDPQSLGRVKIMFPQLSSEYESWWVRTVQPGAGKGRGAVILPEVGDEVLVAFEQGSVGRPYVIGGLYNGVDEPDKSWSTHIGRNDGAIERRSFASRTGMLVEFLEAVGSEELIVSTSDGQQKISLRQSGGGGIEIVSQGPLTIEAQGNTNITSKSGDVSMAARRISISADVALELAGATVSVKGKASAELVADGATTVKGAMVRIN